MELDILDWLKYWLQNDSYKLMYILTLILIANVIDFLVGWLNAKFNPDVKFSSDKAIFGIARKIVLFIILVFCIPLMLLVPEPIGISALYVFYIGYLLSEINSILNHLKLAEDDKEVDSFIDFINRAFKGDGKK
jgi:toxin secretion/phage lysis holin